MRLYYFFISAVAIRYIFVLASKILDCSIHNFAELSLPQVADCLNMNSNMVIWLSSLVYGAWEFTTRDCIAWIYQGGYIDIIIASLDISTARRVVRDLAFRALYYEIEYLVII